MDGIKQHKQLAMGSDVEGSGGNFGVPSFASVNGGTNHMPNPGGSRREYGVQDSMLHDHERGIGKHVKRGAGSMPGQRHPDHGPHFHKPEGAFGVQSFKDMNG